MSHLCNRCIREFLILARTWFAFDLSFKTGYDSPAPQSHSRKTLPKGTGKLGQEAHTVTRHMQ
jgi:hypothetical protein